MVTIENDVWINAPPEQVFEYMATPENHPDVMPSLQEVRNVEELPNGGHTGKFTFKMVGVSNEGRFEDVEFNPPERRVYDIFGDIEGRFQYAFTEEDGGTRVSAVLEFEHPPSVLNKVLAPVAKKYNERELKTTLENVKTIMEAQKEAEPAA